MTGVTLSGLYPFIRRPLKKTLKPTSCLQLKRHKQRAEYVLHMVYSAPFSLCTQLACSQSYGWTVDEEGKVMVDWDDDETVSYLTGSDKGCSCKKSNCTSRCKCARDKKNPAQ